MPLHRERRIPQHDRPRLEVLLPPLPRRLHESRGRISVLAHDIHQPTVDGRQQRADADLKGDRAVRSDSRHRHQVRREQAPVEPETQRRPARGDGGREGRAY